MARSELNIREALTKVIDDIVYAVHFDGFFVEIINCSNASGLKATIPFARVKEKVQLCVMVRVAEGES